MALESLLTSVSRTAVSGNSNLGEEFLRWRQQRLAFSVCSYPFLLSPEAKQRLLRIEMMAHMSNSVRAEIVNYMRASGGHLPPSAPALRLKVRLWLQLRFR